MRSCYMRNAPRYTVLWASEAFLAREAWRDLAGGAEPSDKLARQGHDLAAFSAEVVEF